MMTPSGAKGRRPAEGGMTLIELLVAMVLLGVVSSLVVVGVAQASRLLTHTDDENRGQQDAKVILDRLSRDIRQARGVVCDGAGGDTYCREHLQLWIDHGRPTLSFLRHDHDARVGDLRALTRLTIEEVEVEVPVAVGVEPGRPGTDALQDVVHRGVADVVHEVDPGLLGDVDEGVVGAVRRDRGARRRRG